MTNEIIVSRLEATKLVIETADGVEEYDSQFLVAALLVYLARSSGQIEPEESAKMIELIEGHFQLEAAESLELISRAMTELMERPELATLLADLASALSDEDKEQIVLMALKVIAADGQRHFAEMEQFDRAMQAANISPEIIHRAFDQYFAETMPGS